MTVEIANIVGSGDLDRELDINALESDLSFPFLEYDPDNYHGLYVRLEAGGPLITVYRSGKYIISGCSSFESLHETNDGFISSLDQLGIPVSDSDTGFSVKNIVCTARLGETIDLNSLSILLGLESTEYEPEQFPGLIYRPTTISAVMLVFANGNTVITGCRTIDDAETAFLHLREEISELLPD